MLTARKLKKKWNRKYTKYKVRVKQHSHFFSRSDIYQLISFSNLIFERYAQRENERPDLICVITSVIGRSHGITLFSNGQRKFYQHQPIDSVFFYGLDGNQMKINLCSSCRRKTWSNILCSYSRDRNRFDSRCGVNSSLYSAFDSSRASLEQRGNCAASNHLT